MRFFTLKQKLFFLRRDIKIGSIYQVNTPFYSKELSTGESEMFYEWPSCVYFKVGEIDGNELTGRWVCDDSVGRESQRKLMSLGYFSMLKTSLEVRPLSSAIFIFAFTSIPIMIFNLFTGRMFGGESCSEKKK